MGKAKVGIIVIVSLLMGLMILSSGYTETLKPEAAEAVKKLESMGPDAKPLTSDEIKELKNEISRAYTWSKGGLPSVDEASIRVFKATWYGLDLSVSYDSKGKPTAEFHSCSNKSVVTMKDGTKFLFYGEKWWKIPASND